MNSLCLAGFAIVQTTCLAAIAISFNIFVVLATVTVNANMFGSCAIHYDGPLCYGGVVAADAKEQMGGIVEWLKGAFIFLESLLAEIIVRRTHAATITNTRNGPH